VNEIDIADEDIYARAWALDEEYERQSRLTLEQALEEERRFNERN
jgi:hypothetical protein